MPAVERVAPLRDCSSTLTAYAGYSAAGQLRILSLERREAERHSFPTQTGRTQNIMTKSKLGLLFVVLCCASWAVAQAAPSGGVPPAGSAGSTGKTSTPGSPVTPPGGSTTQQTTPGSTTPNGTPNGTVPGSNSPASPTPGSTTHPSTVNPNPPNNPGGSPSGSPCGTLPGASNGTPGSTPNSGSSSSSPFTSGSSSGQGGNSGTSPSNPGMSPTPGTPCPPVASPSGSSTAPQA